MGIAEDAITRDLAVRNALKSLSDGKATASALSASLLATYGAPAATAFDSLSALIGTGLPEPLVPLTGLTAAGVSLLSTGTHAISLPIIVGKRPIVCFGGFALTAKAAGTVTGTLTFRVGNNGNNDNIIAATSVAAAAFNATTFSLPFFLPLAIAASTGGMPDMGTQVNLQITAALAGVATLQGRFGMQALYV